MLHFQLLKKGQILTLNEQSVFLRVAQGKVWLTRENDNEDYILQNEETLNMAANALTVIEALEDSTVFYSEHNKDRDLGVTHAGARSDAETAATGDGLRTAASAR